jgi:hypothetical protein
MSFRCCADQHRLAADVVAGSHRVLGRTGPGQRELSAATATAPENAVAAPRPKANAAMAARLTH